MKKRKEGGKFSTAIRCLTCYELFEMSLLQGRHSFLLTGNHHVFRALCPCWSCGAMQRAARWTSELGWPFWSTFMGSLFVQLFVHTLLKSCSTALAVSTWHLRTEKLKWSTVPSCCAFYARSETLWNKPDIARMCMRQLLLAFAWLQVTRSALGPPGPRADLVTCNHAKANK